MFKTLQTLLISLALCAPTMAHAWWNKDWKNREQIELNTTAQGVETKAALNGAVIAVRLHAGNFSFADAKPDGADLRFLAADDKTVLKHQIERYDPANELGVVWVQVPTLAPGTAKQSVWLYHGNPNATAESAGTLYDSGSVVFNFSEADGKAADAGPNGVSFAKGPNGIENAGLLGGSAKLNGDALIIAEVPALKRAAGAAWSMSAWLKPATNAKGSVLLQGPLDLAIDGGAMVLRVAGKEAAKGGQLKPDVWQHVAIVADGKRVALYVDGAEAGAGQVALPELAGELRAGEGLSGMLDVLQFSNAPRSEDWLRIAARSQGAETNFPAVVAESEGGGEGGHNYFGILFANLTTDAIVVIGILGVMFVIAVAVMIGKARFVSVTDSANRRFLKQFRDASDDFLDIAQHQSLGHSSLFRLYEAGVRELRKRFVGNAAGSTFAGLSGASLDAVKAAIDADMVRESHKLNSQMVMLTIAISGGPFLGLLGTVVGVMITFAAIAAAGDVNVNAIAPGIAAALLATVAGLGVAIPALFGYNYLASRIKNISADMQIFVDEFVTRVAEQYGAR